MGQTKKMYQDKKRALMEKRRGDVAILLQGGILNYSEIAKSLGVSVETIRTDVKALRAEWALRRTRADEEFDLDMQRIESMIKGLWLGARTGEVADVREVLNCLKRKADMIGYDAPSKQSIKTEVRKVDERDPSTFTEAELDERIAREEARVAALKKGEDPEPDRE